MIRFRGRDVLTSLEEIASPRHTALLVYDALNHNMSGLGPASAGLLTAWRRLIDGACAAGVPVIYTRHRPTYDYASGAWIRYRMKVFGVGDPELLPDLRPADSSAHEIVEQLRPREGDIVLDKYLNSAFAGTPLHNLLQARGIRTLVLSGLVTESGVETTCRQALVDGYYVVVAGDCVGSPRAELHEASLRYMARSAEICTADELVGIWGRP